MRVLVLGAAGQLGSDVVDVLSENSSLAVLGIDLPEIDITDPDSVGLVFGGFDPDFVINCAAYTAVDAAEANEELALRVNGLGPRLIAQECHKASAWLVHVSTDYVFDGEATVPYAEDAVPDPRSAYGRTKLAGEDAVREILPDSHYIIRTAWLYGCHGSNFVRTMLRLEGERDTVSVVDDQRGQPTYSRDLARQIVQVFEKHPAGGTYHATNSCQRRRRSSSVRRRVRRTPCWGTTGGKVRGSRRCDRGRRPWPPPSQTGSALAERPAGHVAGRCQACVHRVIRARQSSLTRPRCA
jgi:dTDP-4-dehydrorhamnose reductase